MDLSLADLIDAIQTNKLTPEAAVEAAINRIDQLNPVSCLD
jgi:Asp-tRNA(Asn)/Glu-tRNA(Gln) amidotransferase A subunit family amidase